MNHKEKLKLAKRLMTQIDIKMHIPPFSTHKWLARKEQRSMKEVSRHQYAVMRKANR